MRRKRAAENVTSDEMTFREFHGANLLFRNSIDNLGCFNQNYSEKGFEYVINRLLHMNFGYRP